MKPKVTAIILTFRRPKLVKRAIESILQQSFQHVCVCVYDDASNDETEEIITGIQRKDSRVEYHRHPKNIGMHANYSFAMARIETPFFHFLSDDDLLLPGFYEKTCAALEENSQAMLVATKVPNVTDAGRVIFEPLTLWQRMGLFLPPEGALQIATFAHPEITGIMFRKEFLDTPWATLAPGVYAWDFEMILNAALHLPILTIDHAGALFVHHTGRRNRPSNPFRMAQDCLRWIDFVEKDDRFPQIAKDAFRERWRQYLASYLHGQITGWSLRGIDKPAEKALKILKNDLGEKRRVAALGSFRHLCRIIPPIRPVLRLIHAAKNQIDQSWKHSFFKLGKAEYQEILKKYK